MKVNLKNLVIFLTGMFISAQASAQLVGDTNSMDQAADQSQGNYQAMNMSYAGFNSLGMIQSAWQDPLQNLGEGQSKPAYSKYYWSPDLVLPMRLREGMITLVNFPEWELLENLYIGDPNAFEGHMTTSNTLMLYPKPGAAVGVDTNMVVFGRSGNKYVFYLRSEGVNTERLTNSIIDIDVVGDTDASGGSPRGGSGILGKGGVSSHINANKYGAGSPKSVDSTFTRRFLKEDWLKSIPLDPTKFKFDIEIYVPNPDDVIIAPERVWHDDIFTYIDLGEKALNMVQRPIVTLIVERSETPIGFRTKGPNNRLIIVEGVGDMVMRSGKRMVCLKMRRSDEDGLQYVTYADTSNEWDIGPKIPGANGGTGSASSSGTGKNKDNMNGVYGSGKDGVGQTSGSSSEEVLKFNPDGTISRPGFGGVYVPNGVPGGGLGDIDCSNMYRIDPKNSGSIANPYPQYKYGSGFNGQNGESLSIELGTDSNVGNLESLWKDLSGRYGNVLGGYEPFYSVDAPADGQGKELFHLRVGPVKNLETGDSVCSQLGRSGVFCSVVRVQ
ncbi:MAG: TrbG/VirB9 family P-type conjugative transfer protein [Alphaproteobacteria bacterium]|nr:TrbG/VirB9 family P-type conjugative transfer protein [Alphaproteobacteria bacterium]